MRRTVQKILFLSALVLLGGALAFQWTHSDTCLGLRFWEDIPDNCQYVYRDYSDVLWFYDQKAAVDVESSTVYISQDIGPETTYAALEGRLTLNNLLTPMYFLRDEAFQDLEAAVREGHRFGLIISTGRRYMRYDVVFTTLPVLAMEDPDSTMLTEKGPIVRGSLSLWSPVDTEMDTYSVKHSLVRWKIRGQTTAELDKKCYKLTLEKNGGGKRNQNLLGLGKDDDWILNAMALDDFKVKEQFAMKLWNRLAEQSPWDYPMSSGAYCEVVLNGHYQGLYLLQRRVDRKYLGLSDGQILLKPDSGLVLNDDPRTPIEVVYPTGTSAAIKELWLDIRENRLGTIMDTNNYADISIFTQLGYLQDNWSYRNLFVLLTPEGDDYRLQYTLWDTDMSMGLCFGFQYDYRESTQTSLLRSDYDAVLAAHPDLDRIVARRWRELREDILSDGSMEELMDSLTGELADSGAMSRDQALWGHAFGDAATPAQFLRDRAAFLDTYYVQ